MLEPFESKTTRRSAPAGPAGPIAVADVPTDSNPTSFTWSPEGSPATVHIDFDVVDRLGFDIMRGFGAVPRRGAEVGGLLLGSAEDSDRTVIRIEDYVPVPCEHLRGPSYILSENDLQALDAELARWAPSPDRRISAVGFYRSNTRDAVQLTPEDIELIESRFPSPAAVCLMVKPYATRIPDAAFFVRHRGRFSTEPALDPFPFRRKELGGGPALPRPRDTDPAPTPASPQPAHLPTPAPLAAPAPAQSFGPLRSKLRSGWVWIPLSFIFLLLGVVLGFQIALGYRDSQPPNPALDPYILDLTVVQFGDNLHLKWNTDAAVFAKARRGVLHIQDGDNSKIVDLKQEDLSRGGVLYRHATPNITFRLEVFPRDRNSVSESVDLRLLEERKPAR